MPSAQSPVPSSSKLSCHSDYVDDPAEAPRIQERGKLVALNTAPAHNLPGHDPII